MIDFKRKAFREHIANEDPGALQEDLTAMLDGCAELARELRITLPQLLEMAAERYATAHDKTITSFESAAEPDGHSTIVVLTDKWRGN